MAFSLLNLRFSNKHHSVSRPLFCGKYLSLSGPHTLAITDRLRRHLLTVMLQSLYCSFYYRIVKRIRNRNSTPRYHLSGIRMKSGSPRSKLHNHYLTGIPRRNRFVIRHIIQRERSFTKVVSLALGVEYRDQWKKLIDDQHK
jgi:hypothetical protein